MSVGGNIFYICTLRFLANRFRQREFATMTGTTITTGWGVVVLLCAAWLHRKTGKSA
jgi:hypothetical protein